MTREEQIKKAADRFADNLMTCDDHEIYAGREGFIEGANFALEHFGVKWREITVDNQDEVYNIPEERLMIAWCPKPNIVISQMLKDFYVTRSTMAKLGGYYYLEIPKFEN